MQRNGDHIMKVKAGPLFSRISKARDYFRLGKENWEKLQKGETVDIKPPEELVRKNYLIKIKKEKENK
jgi:hypothetical protein